MANSITLSSDMNHLYLIDENGNVTFSTSLFVGQGVVIALNASGELTAEVATTSPRGSDFKKPVTNSQWTLTYDAEHKNLYVIGVVDADVSRSEAAEFSLGTGETAQILRSAADLIIDKS